MKFIWVFLICWKFPHIPSTLPLYFCFPTADSVLQPDSLDWFPCISLAHCHLQLIQQTDGIYETVLDIIVHVIFAHLLFFCLLLWDPAPFQISPRSFFNQIVLTIHTLLLNASGTHECGFHLVYLHSALWTCGDS